MNSHSTLAQIYSTQATLFDMSWFDAAYFVKVMWPGTSRNNDF